MKRVLPVAALAEGQFPIAAGAHRRGRALAGKPGQGVKFRQVEQIIRRIEATALQGPAFAGAARAARIVAEGGASDIVFGRTPRHPFRRLEVVRREGYRRAAHAEKGMGEAAIPGLFI